MAFPLLAAAIPMITGALGGAGAAAGAAGAAGAASGAAGAAAGGIGGAMGGAGGMMGKIGSMIGGQGGGGGLMNMMGGSGSGGMNPMQMMQQMGGPGSGMNSGGQEVMQRDPQSAKEEEERKRKQPMKVPQQPSAPDSNPNAEYQNNFQYSPSSMQSMAGLDNLGGMAMQDGGAMGGMGGQMKGMAGKMAMQAANDVFSGVQGMLMKKNGGNIPKYQDGGMGGFDPATLDWLKKQTGGGAGGGAEDAMAIPDNFMQAPEAPGSEPLVPGPGEGQGVPVANAPTNTPAQQMGQPMPGQAPPPMNLNDPNAPAAGTDMNTGQVEQNNASQAAAPAQAKSSMMSTNPVGSIMSIAGQQKDGNDYAKDSEGYTAVSETSDTMGGAMDNLKQGDIIGAGLELVAGTVAQKSQQRKRTRELQIAEGMHDRSQQNQSVYSDPNSVYYSAKDGAPISQGAMKKNNIAGMMQGGGGIMGMLKGILPFQEGGGTNNKTINLGSDQSQSYNKIGLTPGTPKFEAAPKFVQEGDKSFHHNSSYYLHNANYPDREPEQEFVRNFKDKAYDVFHPRKPARVSLSFQEGGGFDVEAGRQADLYPNGQPMNPGDAQWMVGAGQQMGRVPIPINPSDAQWMDDAVRGSLAGSQMGSLTGMMNPVTDLRVRENQRRMVSKWKNQDGSKGKMVTKKNK